MAQDLSERQVRMVEFIREFIADHHFPPTIREIGAKVGIPSTSVVKYNLDILQRRGLIDRDPDISRGIRLVEEVVGRVAEVIRVPLLGRIAAGVPIPVPDAEFSPFGYEAGIELTRDIVKDDKNIYALEVQGNSMVDALINDGDVVIMRHQERVENGELAAVWLPEQGRDDPQAVLPGGRPGAAAAGQPDDEGDVLPGGERRGQGQGSAGDPAVELGFNRPVAVSNLRQGEAGRARQGTFHKID